VNDWSAPPGILEGRLAALAASKEVTLPEVALGHRRRKFKIRGRLLSELIIEDR
jgi:hypothetical protein